MVRFYLGPSPVKKAPQVRLRIISGRFGKVHQPGKTQTGDEKYTEIQQEVVVPGMSFAIKIKDVETRTQNGTGDQHM